MQPDLLGLRADESAAYRALIAIPSADLGTSLHTVQRRVRQLRELTGGRTRMQLGFPIARLGWLNP